MSGFFSVSFTTIDQKYCYAMANKTVLETLVLYILQFTIILPTFFLISLGSFIFRVITVEIPAATIGVSKNSPRKHVQKVLKIQEQVLRWDRGGRKGKMVTGRPAWLTVSLRNYEKNNMSKIFLGNLEEIIEIDTKNKVLRVEPGINMGNLTSELVPLGWTIPVIPEFEFLTVGGCICGAGLETSSHKYGMFVDTCISFEVILSDGSLVTCSKDENPDIFYSIGMSHGTIGFLVGVTFPLIPAAKYVKLEYIHTKSIAEAEKLLQAPEHEFIEGLVYDSSNSIIMYGNFANYPQKGEKINSLGRWYKPWFFKHAESFMNKPGRHVEYIPTRDYYHRHQRSLFWEMEQVIPFGNHPVFRLFMGWVLPFNVAVLKLILPTRILDVYINQRQHLIQDFILPLSKLGKALDFSHDLVKIYPIWLCPVVLSPTPSMTRSAGNKPEMSVDIGIYGNSQKYLKSELKETIRKFEKFTIENQGFQGLYADNYLSKEEFEKMFDVTLYKKVRSKLKCEDAFPHAYDKVSYVARKL